MNNTPRWLWVILISSIQLMLLLIAVVILFTWMGDLTNTMLGQQCCLDNHLLSQRVIDSIETENIRDIRSADSMDEGKLESVVSQIGLPSDCFVNVLDFVSGQSLFHFPHNEDIPADSFVDLPIYSLTDRSNIGTLRESISKQTDQRHVSGSVVWNGNQVLVSARYLPQLNAIILIGQQPSLANHGLAGMLKQYKASTFAITLLIGLIGICLTFIIVRRIGQTITNLSDGLEEVVSGSARELVRTKNAVIFGLAKLAESRDNDTGEHLDRIRIYVTILAKELALSHADFDEEFVRNLSLASSLHDIGKVGIPDSILLKPGRLTPEERGIMEIHTLIGGECLDAIHARLGENEFMNVARQIAYYHHERWDGTGYPHSLKETEIPLVARIVAVADVYDALTSKRPYKKAMTHLESKEIIVAGSGKHFDPQIVDAFLRHDDEFEEVSIHQQTISDDAATSNFQRLCEAAKS